MQRDKALLELQGIDPATADARRKSAPVDGRTAALQKEISRMAALKRESSPETQHMIQERIDALQSESVLFLHEKKFLSAFFVFVVFNFLTMILLFPDVLNHDI